MSENLPKVHLNIGAASPNQTVYDFSRNVPNILKIIDWAVENNLDAITLPELSLTGYAADDYHQWFKSNDQVWPYIEIIAQYAKEKNPNLIVSLGTPWHYADKSKPVTDPEYNLNNRPYNTQMTIHNGEVVGISAKTIMADGQAEYETRQFSNWPLAKGTVPETLPNGKAVPLGKPVIAFKDNEGRRFTLFHEQCAEGWIGVDNDLTINVKEQNEGRHLSRLTKDQDISVALNPSASKPEPELFKEQLRMDGVCKTGSERAGVYVYTNVLGSDSGIYAAEGSQIFAQDGEIIHHGERYSHKPFSASSVKVELPPVRRLGMVDAVVDFEFTDHPPLQKTGQESDFERAFNEGKISPEELVYEDYLRGTVLWLRDILAKQDFFQGYVISDSGGKDSAYGKFAVSMMVEEEVRQNGIEGFFETFPKLDYKDDVLEIYKTEGERSAVKALKSNLLTLVGMPTENNSADTRNGARFNAEGGTLPNGEVVAGVGGTFFEASVQELYEQAIIAYTGLVLKNVAVEYSSEILDIENNKDRYDQLSESQLTLLAKAELQKQIMAYVNTEDPNQLHDLPDYITDNCENPVPTWSDPKYDIMLQNFQARVRNSPPWAVADQQRKMSLVTSNKSEAVHGYTTKGGGDMDYGRLNPIGAIPKEIITKSLKYFYEKGPVGYAPVRSLHFVVEAEASAELRKLSENTPAQTDEDDLGFTYPQSRFIEKHLLTDREQPWDVLRAMRKEKDLFPHDGSNLERDEYLRDIILKFSKRFFIAQYKRISSVLAPHQGGNVDPHNSVRTTLLGDHFNTACAQMTVNILEEQMKDEAEFKEKTGVIPLQARTLAGLSAEFKGKLLSEPLESFFNPEAWKPYVDQHKSLLEYLAPPVE